MSDSHENSPEKNMSAEAWSDAFSTHMFLLVFVGTVLFAGSVILFVLP